MVVVPSALLLTQVDHLSGEDLAALVDRLIDLGAGSVQCLPATSKKGRPSHLLMLDAPQSREAALSQALAAEFGVAGYHRIATQHVHHPSRVVERIVSVGWAERRLQARVRCKELGPEGAPLFCRVENDDLQELVVRLRSELEGTVALIQLRALLEATLASTRSEVAHVELTSDGTTI